MPEAKSNAAWRAKDLLSDAGWVVMLTPGDADELDSALRTMKSSGVSPGSLDRTHFPLPKLAHKLESVRNELTHGRGLVLLRGLPVSRYSIEDCARIYYGLGLHLGSPIGQNPKGDLIGNVRDEGRDWKVDPTARAYQTTGWLPFHTDPGDVVGLLCLKGAKSGGLSSISSAAAIHDFLLAEQPDILSTLSQPFAYDSRGQEPPGEAPWHSMPVFERWDHGVSTFFVHEYIESAQRFEDAPRLTDPQREAIRVFDALSVDDRFRVDMAFEPGDIQLLNNHVVLHSRTAFEDFDEPQKKRHLLRLWLNLASYDSLPPGYRAFMARLGTWPRRMNAFS